MSERPAPERILVVVAHPDDVDFGAAGSIARWTSEGIAVSYCLCTDGDAGGSDESVSRAEMARIRRQEQTAAAETLGVHDLHWLAYPDGRLYVTHDLRRDISRVIRQVRPQRVVCPSPIRNLQRVFASHPDHLACGEASLSAVYPDARNPFAHPELLDEERLEPHAVGETWLMAFPEGDTWVDITDTFDRKVAALRCHVSQVGHFDDLEGMLRTWASTIAQQGGLPEGRLAEGFKALATA